MVAQPNHISLATSTDSGDSTYSVDRFTFMENTKLLRFNARWRDLLAKDVDNLHLDDKGWRREHK
eukprot:scaffold597948_cov32-Prasinocladus_malaysianus.AAC.1